MHFPIKPIDLFNGAPLLRGDLQLFNPIRTSWQTWVKPKGVTMCFMLAIGGGAGGGSGFGRATGTSGGGGGGGASGGVSRFLIPAFFLPENLFIQVGEGGQGGAPPSTAGGAGGISYISLGRSTSNPNLLFQSSATAPGGGGAGGNAVAGAGGTVATVAVTTNALLQLGIFSSNVSSIAGGAGAGGSITAYADGQIFMSAAGGGGNTTAANAANLGGAINATAAYEFITNGGTIANSTSLFPLVPGGIPIFPQGGVDGKGNPGLNFYTPFIFTGGSGGGSSSLTADLGGPGGNGGIGCGGGGGGSGTGAANGNSNGGKGGNGGPGMVFIYSW